MAEAKGQGKATLDRVPGTTGRDGAIDFAAKTDALSPAEGAVSSQDDGRFIHVIGAAAIAVWSDLPQQIQERLFEQAVVLGHKSERDEMLREQLAKYLHDHHKRTIGS